MAAASSERFIVRAELRAGDDTVISYGFDLTSSSVFVVTEWHAPIGTQVSVRLSFPRILAPIDIVARIADIRVAGEPGEPGGIRLTFDEAEVGQRLMSQLEHAEAPIDGAVPDRPYRVLLVDDSWLIRDMFAHGTAQFFDRPGALAIDHAEDAEEAWGKLAKSTYDLVIVDYFLPAEDGASLIARLRADSRLARTPVVAISVGGRDAREATISAGADVFVDKPLVFRDLFNTLRVLAERRERSRPPPERKAILVFDDSPFALALTRAALEAAGFTVAIAADLSSFERQRVAFDPDLILVDVQMPEAFGDDIASTLRGWHGVQVPILLVSSLEQSELERRAVRAQASGYICKGAGMSELVRRCRELLEVST
ncbi:MAG TPA: response regulator [Kofleriaceae bacterium]|nr:response regulator [Kofleriaceae bacterium]HMG52852.1 response regulator [Kofleriaceae bacterium]